MFRSLATSRVSSYSIVSTCISNTQHAWHHCCCEQWNLHKVTLPIYIYATPKVVPMSPAQEAGCNTVKGLTQSRPPWVVPPVPAPRVWVADWLWQNPAGGYPVQTLMLRPHAAAQDRAATCNLQVPIAQAMLNYLKSPQTIWVS